MIPRGLCALGKKTTSVKVPFLLYHMNSRFHPLVTVDIDLGHLAAVLSFNFLHCGHSILPYPLLSCPLWKEVIMNSPHLRSYGAPRFWEQSIYMYYLESSAWEISIFSLIYLFIQPIFISSCTHSFVLISWCNLLLFYFVAWTKSSVAHWKRLCAPDNLFPEYFFSFCHYRTLNSTCVFHVPVLERGISSTDLIPVIRKNYPMLGVLRDSISKF